MRVRLETRPLKGVGEGDQVLLVTPTEHVEVGREVLESPKATGMSAVDRQIVNAAARPSGNVRVTVFCGADDEGSWAMQPELEAADVDAVAERLVEAQLSTLRALFVAGVCMHVRLDVSAREQLAFRRAHATVRKRLEAQRDTLAGVDAELADFDIWLLKSLVFFFVVSVERLLSSTLGNNTYAIKSRLRAAATRREALSPEALARIHAATQAA